jgi:hypothetical protein
MFARIGSRIAQELEQAWASMSDHLFRGQIRAPVGRPSIWDRERTWEQSPDRKLVMVS